MFGYQMNEYDKTVYDKEIRDFLPPKLIDVHTHVYKKEFAGKENREGLVSWTGMVADECTIEDLDRIYLDLFPGKKVIPVIMADPTRDISKGNSYIEECVEKTSYRAYYCTKYNTTEKEIEKAILEKGFCGIKPYLSNAPDYIPAKELRIYDLLPQNHLEIINERKAIVMLHIPRDLRLKDPVNLMQIMEIEEKYPNLQLIIAHVGRAYAPEDIGNAFQILKDTKNLVFDFSANTLQFAMEECIKAVGCKRILFGTDMPITKMRMKRVTEQGVYYNIVPKGLYGDVSKDVHMRETEGEELTNFVYEEILAFQSAAEKLGLGRNDIEDVFYGNAQRIFKLEV